MTKRVVMSWLTVLSVLCIGSLWPSAAPRTSATIDITTGGAATASSIAADPFGIAHISAVNSQYPTYSSQRYQQATAAGAAWNRWVFYWHEIEPNAGSPDYGAQEATVNQDVANGFRHKIDAVLMGTPGWTTTAAFSAQGTAAPPPRVGQHSYGEVGAAAVTDYSSASPVTYPPSNLYASVFSDGSDSPGAAKTINQSNYWARFVYNTVYRFKDRVRHWEIWNEPDYQPSDASGWYGFWSGSADDYFRLLKVAYLAAKAADSSAVVVMGGMAYWPEVVQQNRAPFTFFRRVLDLAKADPLGAANAYFFDTTAWHWYNRSNQSYYKVLDTKNVLNSYGLGSKPIWLNESGIPAWNDGRPGPYFGSGTMTEQASYIMQAIAYGLAAGVERTLVFQEYDDGNGEAFGLIRNNGSPRAAYYAYQMATRYLTGTTSAALSAQGSAHIVTATTTSGKRVSVLWNNSPAPTQATVTASAASALLLAQPTEANLSGTQQTVYPSGGRYTVTLPGATDNNGIGPDDYIVGGLVSLVVEEVGGTPAPNPISSGLIANGGFEGQPSFTGWTTGGYVPPQLLPAPYGGSYAVLGKDYLAQPGLGGANSTLQQDLVLPLVGPQLFLKFRYAVASGQPPPYDLNDPYSYDKFEVLLIDGTNTRRDLHVDWTSRPAWVDWEIDLRPYRGQSVRLIFNVWQSEATSNTPTSVYLDNVSLWPYSGSTPSLSKNAG